MSLKFKIAATTFSVGIVVVLLVLWQVLSASFETTRRQMERADGSMLNLLANLSKVAAITAEFTPLEDLFAQTAKSSHVKLLALSDHSGRVVASNDAGLVGEMLIKTPGDQHEYWRHAVISGASGRLGTLAVRYTTAPLVKARNEIWSRGLVLALAGMLITAATSLMIGYMLTRRMGRLAAATEHVHSGDLDVDIDVQGNDEIGKLATAFRQMLESLKSEIARRQLNEDRFRDFAASASDWYWELDADYRITWISEELRGRFDNPSATIMSRTPWAYFGVDLDEPGSWKDLKVHLDARRSFRDFRFNDRNRSGSELLISASARPVFDAEGTFKGYRGATTDITQSHQLEQTYRQIVEHSPTSTYVHDEERIIYANAACADLYRASSPAELIGVTVLDLIHPDERREFLHRRSLLMAGGRQPTGEERRLTLDGTEIVVEARGARIWWEGQPAILGVHIDVTERKRTEQALRRSEERYRQLFQLAPEGLFVYSGEIVRLANPAACEIFGARAPEDLIGRSVQNLIHPDSLPAVERYRQEALDASDPLPFIEVVYRRLDGTTFPAETRGTWFDMEGQPMRLVIVRDITAQKNAYEALRESEERFRDFAESASDWLWESDAAHRITSVSEGARDTIGDDPETWVGTSVGALFFQPAAAGYGWVEFDRREAFRDKKFIWPRADGSQVWIEVSGKPTYGSDGAFLGYRGVGTNVTVHRELEEARDRHMTELARVQRQALLGEMASALAHEVNQPIAAISNYASGAMVKVWSGRYRSVDFTD